MAYGPMGTPLVLSGSNLGDNGEVWFVSYKNGAVDANAASVRASVTLWTPTVIFLSVPAGATSGLVKAVTNGRSSNGLPFMVMPGAYSGSCPAGPAQSQLQIQTASLQDGAVNQSYSATLRATGGSNSYAWTIIAGSLPAGLTLSSSGTISGTPSVANGPVSITVQVADTSTPQQHDAATLSIEVAGQPEAVSTAALYSYSVGYDPAGNVIAYTDSVNGTWSFNYDTLNRMATATGSQADNPYPNLCWSYDSFGNRMDQMSASVAFPSGQGGANSCSTTGSLGQNVGAQYNVSNTNRIDSSTQNPNQSQYYDQAGNITNDGVNAYLYDGEGRICAVQQSFVPGIVAMTQYLYDAEGNRVAKGSITNWAAGCDTTQNGFTPQSAYVLGPHGEQLTEMSYTSGAWQWAHTNVMASGLSATYDADPTGQTAGPLYFHLSDWLGTRRQQTDFAGNPVLNFTGLPFGDGLTTIPVANTDAANATEHHYTGKERDTESGNDYFGARYYSSAMGRFMSPDWSGSASPVPYALFGDPQTLNLYSYMRNNPLGGTDPDGHCGICWDIVMWAAQAIARDGGVKPFAQNVGAGIAKGAGRQGMVLAAGLAEKAVPGSIVNMSMNKSVQKAFQATTPSNQTQADVAPVGAAITNTAVTAGVGGLASLESSAAESTLVLAGHGAWDGSMMTLPEGTSLTIPSALGNSISDAYGNALETGANLAPFSNEMVGAQSFLPGSQAPDLTLYPPTPDLNIAPTSTTVNSPTSLSNIAQPNQGCIVWAACTSKP